MGSPVCFCGFLFVPLGVLPLHLFSTAELLPALLDTARAGVVLCTPVRDVAGVVMDFPFACLNPAGRRWVTRRPGRQRTCNSFRTAVPIGCLLFSAPITCPASPAASS